MARTRHPQPRALDRTSDREARALLARYYEAERAFPHLTQPELARMIGVRQRDPGRFIRKLRTGETSGRKTFARVSKPPDTKEPGTYVVDVRIGTDASGRAIIRKAKISVPGNTPRMDVGRLLRTRSGRTAVQTAIKRTEETSPTLPGQTDDADEWQPINIRSAQHRVTKVVRVDWGSAA